MLQIVNVEMNSIRKGIRIPSLPKDAESLAELSRILTGQHEYSVQTLFDAPSNSEAKKLGADKCLWLVFDESPKGGFGVGGAYGVTNWVNDYLEDAMPAGMGAAHSELFMYPLVGNKAGTDYHVVFSPPEQWRAVENGLPIAFISVISPMDRSVTQALGAYLVDADDFPGSDGILPIGRNHS